MALTAPATPRRSRERVVVGGVPRYRLPAQGYRYQVITPSGKPTATHLSRATFRIGDDLTGADWTLPTRPFGASVREAHFLSSGQELVNAAACGKTDSGSPPTSGCAVIHSLSAFRSVKLLASSLTCPSLPELALVRMKSSRPSARAAWAKCTAPKLGR